MFRLKRRGRVEYWATENFVELGFVTHGFCTRRSGVSEEPFASLNVAGLIGDNEVTVAQNLAAIETAFAVTEGRLVLMEQVHGDRVCVLDSQSDPPTRVPGCDGLLTSQPGVALGVKTADCVPLLFVDPVQRVIGVAHAGWRGTALGIAGKMVRLFGERFGTRQEDLLVAIGPAIGQCCYEVDTPVREAFSGRRGSSSWLHASPKRKGRWCLDLVAANRFELEDLGVLASRISHSGQCTACRTNLFFSHRAEAGRTGRQLSLLMLTEKPQ